jgi:predicted hotdog family 3-hydroxylacyl-ACP dehydratase
LNYKDINILELLPQRPPFVMVDHLTDYSDTQSSCCLTIRPDNIFLENGCLASAGIIEHIAQTCAARLGYYNCYILKTGVRLGFIGEVKDLCILRLPREGELIETTITVVQEIFDVTLVTAEVRVGTEVIVTTRLKIAQGEASEGPSPSLSPEEKSI